MLGGDIVLAGAILGLLVGIVWSLRYVVIIDRKIEKLDEKIAHMLRKIESLEEKILTKKRK